MKRVVIVDDEEDARDLLRFYISMHPEFEIVGEAKNGFEAIEMINKLIPDTVFLDIQMPGPNGFEVLTQLDVIPEIVFSTAFDNYAIKAFEVHAIDYLLKPYDKKRFETTLQRIVKNQESLVPLTESLLTDKTTFPTKVILQKGTRKLMVNVSEILYCEAFGDYTKVYTRKDTFLSSKGISELNELLDPSSFIRIHRSHFVQLDRIQEVKKQARYYYVVLITQKELKVSETYLPQLKNMLL